MSLMPQIAKLTIRKPNSTATIVLPSQVWPAVRSPFIMAVRVPSLVPPIADRRWREKGGASGNGAARRPCGNCGRPDPLLGRAVPPVGDRDVRPSPPARRRQLEDERAEALGRG